MDMKKCDRCGSFYQPEDWEQGDIVIKKRIKKYESIFFNEYYFIDYDIDLCPGCRSYIKDWITKKEKEN